MKSKYWYQTEIYFCNICGKEKKYKHRIYNIPKPKDIDKRIICFEDVCPEHFM